MPEFNCGSCGKLLKTPDGSEGKQGRCPHCGAVMHIPGGKPAAAPPTGPQLNPAQTSPRPSPQMKPGQPGPQPSKPSPAPGAFPQFGSGGPAPGFAAPVNPFGNLPPQGHPGFGAPMGPGMGRRQGPPHRGGMILTFGIISLIGGIGGLPGCLCCLFYLFPLFGIGFGIPAWLMGQRDLKLMRAGHMDRSGEGQTKTGFTMGIVGLCLGCLSVLMIAGWLIFSVVMQAGMVN